MRADWAYLLIGASLAFCAAADEALSSDFLEFLGNGAESSGQWIDPMSLHDSPEVFASMPPAKEDTKQRSNVDRRPDAPPARDSSTPTRTNDGGKEDD
jgi:hypothetical protein